ncbi:MAG: molybdopterin-binding protein [Comamonadaceae bacterium]|nr:molybdopterin-binding protein [Comamonadaceae bacterium]
MVLGHDITEIRQGEFKGGAFKKGHIVRQEDLSRLRDLGKEHLFVLIIAEDEMHENEAAHALAEALMGTGVVAEGEPKEGKINIVAGRDGLFRVNADKLTEFNMLGEVMCATIHTHTVVRKGQLVAGTRAIPLIIRRDIVQEAVNIAKSSVGLLEVAEMRRPRAGIVITGNEVYSGRVKDAFAPVITKKIEQCGGTVVGLAYAPDDERIIGERLREMIDAGADLLITTGGMSVDPDDVTRFAVRSLGAVDMTYGSAVLPGAMVLVAYVEKQSTVGSHQAAFRKHQANTESKQEVIPVLGIPACGMYHKTTIFDLVLPRILAGERIGRRELAELGHGGLCLNCKECRFPRLPLREMRSVASLRHSLSRTPWAHL